MLQCLRCSLPALLVIAPLTNANSPPSEPNEITRTINSDIVEAGDMLQILLPAAGLFAAWMYDDAEGAKQLVYATAST